MQLPYSPEYKVAPEWHPIMELVHSEHKQQLGTDGAEAAAQHMELHRRVLAHELVQALQLHAGDGQQSQHARVGLGYDAALQAGALPSKLLVGVHFPDLEPEQLRGAGHDPAGFHPAAAAAADWQAPLAELVAAAAAADGRSSEHLGACTPELLARGAWELEVAVCPQVRGSLQAGSSFVGSSCRGVQWSPHVDSRCAAVLVELTPALCRPLLCCLTQDLSEVLFWLSNQAAVNWLAPRPRLYLQNSVASMIVQVRHAAPCGSARTRPAAAMLQHQRLLTHATTSACTARQNNGASDGADFSKPDAHAFWAAGLTGKGQVVGIGDSGIDMQSCFFRDPAVPFVPPSDGTKVWSSTTHRKVVLYWGLADAKFRDLVGHGTHTSGSVAGLDLASPAVKATGAAHGAKLAFADLSMTMDGDVNAPQDLESSYYPTLYNAGACVFSGACVCCRLAGRQGAGVAAAAARWLCATLGCMRRLPAAAA